MKISLFDSTEMNDNRSETDLLLDMSRLSKVDIVDVRAIRESNLLLET